MNNTSQAVRDFLDRINCFGDYTKSSPVCARHCVLRLRCAIKQDHNMRMELLEDLIVSEALPTKIQ